MSRKESIKREVFLDDLPRWKYGVNKEKIDWKISMGYKVKFTYDDIEGTIEITGYNSKTNKIYIKYEDNDIFEINTGNFIKCRLGNLLEKYTNKFKIEIGQIFKDDKRDLVVLDREYRKDKNKITYKYYKYKCNKCGYDKGWMVEGSLLNGVGCSCCNNKIAVEGINDIPTTDPWMIKFFQGGYDEAKLYTKASGKKIKPICPDCGRVKDKEIQICNIYAQKHISCPFCGDGFSYPNKFMFNILEQLNIKYETEMFFKWCRYEYNNKIKKGYYDFYFIINNKQYIVEMDGWFHSKDNKMNGQTAEESQYIDNMKDKLAKEYNIEMIRIDCEKTEIKYVKNNVLKSNLNGLFDLSNIDWLKCEEFALKNRAKEACEYKKNNPDLTITDIGKIMRLKKQTIRKYLKQGSELGWCDYDTKEEMRKNGKKICERRWKQKTILTENVG